MNECAKCGRKLTAIDSRFRGYGPCCNQYVRAAERELRKANTRQAYSALRLLQEPERIIKLHLRHIKGWVFMSAETDAVYITVVTPTGYGCNCPSGLRSKRTCYHEMVATVLAA